MKTDALGIYGAAEYFCKKFRRMQNPLLNRIRANPNICFGKPCIRGTRIWV
ncbi:MAG: DUF433 domain-containing protein, partial [Saprospiraceae bacterium]|nr:DUF433 domain-containing protein [Saprospiraceae bacterium]